MNAIRNRIKEHRRVRAGDLVPHELTSLRRSPGASDSIRSSDLPAATLTAQARCSSAPHEVVRIFGLIWSVRLAFDLRMLMTVPAFE